MIVLKLPADASDHPYQLVDVVASTGSVVTKGDPVFKLTRAGSQRKTTFRAPVDGTIGRYLVGVGTELLSEPGQHIVTMERAQSHATSTPMHGPDAVSATTHADKVEMLLPNDPELLPARIDAWLVGVGDAVALGQPIAQITLGDGRQWELTSKAAGRLEMIAAQRGEYITQMQRLCCTIAQDAPEKAATSDPLDRSKTPRARAAPKKPERTVPHLAMGPDVPENYPMRLTEWHVQEGDFVAKGQILMTLRRASGHASLLRSVETGRIISTHVTAGTEFGISDVLYAVSTAEKPPAGWRMPPDPPIPTAAPEPIPKSSTASASGGAEKPVPKEGKKTTEIKSETAAPTARHNAQPQDKNAKQPNFWLYALLFVAALAVSTTYLFTGSRIIAVASTAAFLFILIIAARNVLGFAIGGVLFGMTGVLLVAPQDIILPSVVTPWEPFGPGSASPDGAWHGDVWENITRPRPTKQQQAQFDAWLEE